MAGRAFAPAVIEAADVVEGDKLLLAWGASEASFWLVEQVDTTAEGGIVFHVRKMDFAWTDKIEFAPDQLAVVVRAS